MESEGGMMGGRGEGGGEPVAETSYDSSMFILCWSFHISTAISVFLFGPPPGRFLSLPEICQALFITGSL